MTGTPRDLLGIILHRMLSSRLDESVLGASVRHWRMTVVLETEYHPVTLRFDEGLTIERGAAERPTLTVLTTLDTVAAIARSSLSPLTAYLHGLLRVKGMYRHPLAAARFLRLLLSAVTGRRTERGGA